MNQTLPNDIGFYYDVFIGTSYMSWKLKMWTDFIIQNMKENL